MSEVMGLDADGVREINRVIKKVDGINGPNVANSDDSISIGGAQAGRDGRDGEDGELPIGEFPGDVLQVGANFALVFEPVHAVDPE